MRIGRRLEALLISPLLVAMLGFIVFPVLVLFGYSLFAWLYVQPQGDPTLNNYIQVLTDPLYRTIAVNTLLIGIPTAALSVAGGYVLAYYIVFGGSTWRGIVLVLVVTALMASFLVRIYAWRTLLGATGVVNSILAGLGLIDRPVEFFAFSKLAAVIAEVSVFLPLAALTFFAALSGVSPDLRGAARDLGASRLQALRRITIPLTGPAILASTALIFFLSAGDFITPVFVGGVESVTVGIVIANAFGVIGNFGMGAALSFLVLLAFVLVYAGLRAGMRAGNFLPERTGQP